MKHLNEVYEESTTNCLIATQTHCVLENGAMHMVLRGSGHAFDMLDWAEPTGRTEELVLVMCAQHLKETVFLVKIIADSQ